MIQLPDRVVATVSRYPSGRDWLSRLPALVAELTRAWRLEIGSVFHSGSCAWVAPVTRADGSRAVLKVSWPHREAEGEPDALRRWNGDGVVRLLAHDPQRHALLLERCQPGTTLGQAEHLSVPRRLTVGATILLRLWQADTAAASFDRLSEVAVRWADLVEERMERLRARLGPGENFDAGLVRHGVRLLRELPRTARRDVLLHGDINPGNVLAADRRPWLAIDPKPMVGDPAYDPWPLIEQIDDPVRGPFSTLVERTQLVADAVGEDRRRIAAWAVARRVEAALWDAAHGAIDSAAETMARVRVLARLAEL